MSETTEQAADNVLEFGGGGRIYRDSRPEQDPEEQESPAVPPPPWADQPEPMRQAKSKKQEPKRPASVVRPVEPPKPPKEPHDWRETISTVFEVAGMAGLTATGFLITLWLGVLIASICMLVIGVAISRTPVRVHTIAAVLRRG